MALEGILEVLMSTTRGRSMITVYTKGNTLDAYEYCPGTHKHLWCIPCIYIF